MDANAVVSAIGSVGFPIVACCIMFYIYDRTLKEFTASLNGLVTEIKELREEIKTTLDEIENA